MLFRIRLIELLLRGINLRGSIRLSCIEFALAFCLCFIRCLLCDSVLRNGCIVVSSRRIVGILRLIMLSGSGFLILLCCIKKPLLPPKETEAML